MCGDERRGKRLLSHPLSPSLLCTAGARAPSRSQRCREQGGSHLLCQTQSGEDVQPPHERSWCAGHQRQHPFALLPTLAAPSRDRQRLQRVLGLSPPLLLLCGFVSAPAECHHAPSSSQRCCDFAVPHLPHRHVTDVFPSSIIQHWETCRSGDAEEPNVTVGWRELKYFKMPSWVATAERELCRALRRCRRLILKPPVPCCHKTGFVIPWLSQAQIKYI